VAVWVGEESRTNENLLFLISSNEYGFHRLLYGFMGREDVNAALFNQEPGTFIIRFSERFAGQFAIAYIGNEAPNKIKHYLVQPNDTAAAKKTLPDFLDECRQFTKLLVLSYDAFERPTFIDGG